MEQLREWFIENKFKALLLAITIIGLIVIGLMTQEKSGSRPEGLLAVEEAGFELSSSWSETVESVDAVEPISEVMEIIVDVKGAVRHPGVYELSPNSRVADAIAIAGGISDVADLNQVNQALLLQDQMVVFVPEIGQEIESLPVLQNQSQTAQTNSNTNSAGVININKATKEELMTISGIGDKKAADIIAYRESKGSFKTIEELMEVSGIGQKTFDKLKDQISI